MGLLFSPERLLNHLELGRASPPGQQETRPAETGRVFSSV
jgi:hypothetical protein